MPRMSPLERIGQHAQAATRWNNRAGALLDLARVAPVPIFTLVLFGDTSTWTTPSMLTVICLTLIQFAVQGLSFICLRLCDRHIDRAKKLREDL